MKQLIFLILFSSFIFHLYAQEPTVVRLDSVNLVGVSGREIYFFHKSDSSLIEFAPQGLNNVLRMELESMAITPYDNINIGVENMKTLSVEEWENLLETHKIFKEERISRNRSGFQSVKEIWKMNDDFLAEVNYDYLDYEKENGDIERFEEMGKVQFIPYYYIQIEGTNILVTNNFFVIPTQDFLLVSSDNYNPLQFYYNQLPLVKEAEKKKLLKNSSITRENIYKKEKNEDNTFSIATNIDTRSRIFTEKYDDFQENDNFIITKKDRQIVVYNYFLEKMEIENIQMAKFMHTPFSYLSVVASNEAKILWHDGEDLPPNEVTSISVLDPEKASYDFTIGGGQMRLRQRWITVHTNKTGKTYTFTKPSQNIQAITFSNKTPTQSYWMTNHWDVLMKENLFISKNNKFGVAHISSIVLDSNDFDLSIELPMEFDKLEKIMLENIRPELLDPKMHNNIPEAILFYKDNLIGVFPAMKEVKYQLVDNYIEANRFVRFTLPSGQKGWVDIEDGEEALDITK